ncbi:MAG: hypothetical protein H6Q18_529 [Bacteroidetes bacterium]|nr:hypothetical protein [Bacteroidota bacterium]
MNILKIFSRIGQSAFIGQKSGRSNRNWFLKTNSGDDISKHDAEIHTLTRSSIRNGSRGEGVGMGHRNKKVNEK